MPTKRGRSARLFLAGLIRRPGRLCGSMRRC